VDDDFESSLSESGPLESSDEDDDDEDDDNLPTGEALLGMFFASGLGRESDSEIEDDEGLEASGGGG